MKRTGSTLFIGGTTPVLNPELKNELENNGWAVN